jgi:hypothetical protein
LVAKGFIVAAAAIAGTAIGNEINKAVDRHTDTDADKSNRAVNKRSLGISASADKKRRRAAQLQNSGKISDQKEAERLLREADAEELQVAQKSSYNPLTKKVTPLAGVTDFLQGKGLMPSDEAMSGATAVNQGYGRKIEALKRRKKELGTPVHKEIDMEIAELEKQLMTFTINFKAGEGFSIGLDNSRGLRKGGD